MIVPRSRLIIWVAIVALPFAIAAGLSHTLLVAALVAVSLLAGIAIADALLGRSSIEGISVTLPPVSRMSLQRDSQIDVHIGNESQKQRLIRLALGLPAAGFAQAHEELTISLPAGSEWSRLGWACRPLKRGHFAMEKVYLESHSPLGFWSHRRKLPVSGEIRVYPNLLEERKGLALLFRGGMGAHNQRQIGKGREFEKLREYVPGDGLEDVHWKATARRGRPITKVFQVERTQEIYLVIDASRLSARDNMLEHFLTASLLVGMAAERQGDLFGLISFSDKVESFVRARNGKAHYNTCRDSIYALQPRRKNPDFEEIFSFIRLKLRRRAMIVFLTSLDDPVLAESFARNVGLVSGQHLVVAGIAQPAATAPLFTGEPVKEVGDIYDRLGGHLRWHSLEELSRVLQRRGVKTTFLQGEQMGLQLVTQYLTLKKRQLL